MTQQYAINGANSNMKSSRITKFTSRLATACLALMVLSLPITANGETPPSLEDVIWQETVNAFTSILPQPDPSKSALVSDTLEKPGGQNVATKMGGFNCFPTCPDDDGRFLVIANGALFSSLSEPVLELGLAIPEGTVSFSIGFFDGDSADLDTNGDSRWDNGFPASVEYTLLADPLGDGAGTMTVDLSGSSSQLSGTMPNNDWIDYNVVVGPEAQAPSGAYFYRLRVELLDLGITTMNAFKVRTSGRLLTLETQVFSYIANFASMADGMIIYPMLPLAAPTTYDGTFSFFLEVPPEQTDLAIWDGDFDRGAFDGSDADTDDLDTPGAPSLPPWATTDAVPEGAASGSPPDDQDPTIGGGFGIYQLRSPSINYDLIAPGGQVFANDNPSGDQEWEQFNISTAPFDPLVMDYSTPSIPHGIYEVAIDGLDMQNLNALSFPFRALCTDDLGNPCIPDIAPFLVGDTVFLDLNADGVQDPGEPGIEGVIVVLKSPGGTILGTATTDANGNYSFFVNPGTYTVEVVAENFDPGNPLHGHATTTGNSLTFTVVDDNILDYDFGYIETTNPICFLQNVQVPPDTPTTTLTIHIQDAQSGIDSIVATTQNNASLSVPPFLPGEQNLLVVTGAKIVEGSPAQLQLEVTDVAGNTTVCDPVITLVIRENGQPVTQTFDGIPDVEGFIEIVNGDPGVKHLDIEVNGVMYKMKNMGDNEVMNMEVFESFVAGNNNTISLTARGKPGGSVVVVISD